MKTIFQKIKSSSYTLHDDVYLLPGKKETDVAIPQDVERSVPEHWTVLKDSRSVLSFLDPDRECFIKVYRKKGLLRTLKRLWERCPRSYRCLAGAVHLKHLHIATPEVWASGRSFLVTETLAQDVKFLNYHPVEPAALLDLVGKLHRGGMIHGDLNYRNIYHAHDGSFGLIDLDGVRLYETPVPQRDREQELARVLSSAFFFLTIFPREEIEEMTASFCAEYEQMTSLGCDRKVVSGLIEQYLDHVKEFRRYGKKYYEYHNK